MKPSVFVTDFPECSSLLDWYAAHGRKLPWRSKKGQTPNPYHVWLSEIMLQQTNVTTVIPYFDKFIKLWPNVRALADAPEQEVLSAWAGLGYYARARNLIACAKVLAIEDFPRHEFGLAKLPGVGAYTAAAISAIAFDQRAVVIDANIERIVARLRAIDAPMPGPGKKAVYAAMDALTPHVRVGDFAQAMMDLGAGICKPRNPDCAQCPLRQYCEGFRIGAPERFPHKKLRLPRPEKFGHAYVARRSDGAYLLRTRPERGLLGGMAEFFGGEWIEVEPAPSPPFRADWRRAGSIRHVFTHFALSLTVWCAEVSEVVKTPKNGRWSDGKIMRNEPLPALMRKVEHCAKIYAGWE